MTTIMFYTDKAGLNSNGIRKLEKAGIIAVRCKDTKEVSFPGASDIDFSAVRDELSYIMLNTLTERASSDTYVEMTLGKHILSAMNKAAAKSKSGAVS